MTFHIETERLLLREFRFTDVKAMFKLDSNPIVHTYLGKKPQTDISESEKKVSDVITQYGERGIGRWVAIEKSSNEIIGWSGLKLNTEETMNGHTNFIDIGYRLMPEFWGKGYATESAIAALEYGFKTMHLPIIYGITEIENQASHKVLLKIGLQLVKTFYHNETHPELRWYELKQEDYE